ncbi:MAG: inositol monophosphatase family protein [Candidatus Binatia bacterium]
MSRALNVVEDFERIACAVVSEAGMLVRSRWQHRKKEVAYKGAIDLVTETDRDVEGLVVERLQRAFPAHLIVAEEASATTPPRPPAADRYVWYLDPLDGTTNFAHTYPQFCVSLALSRGSQLLFGIVYDPVRAETFTARRGRGARLNGQPIRVSPLADLDRALLATGFPYDRQEHVDFYLSFFADFMACTQGIRRSGSAALDLCYVACGRFDGFWEWKLHPWDTAAGALIVREAGGSVTDFRGGPFDLYGAQTLATNDRLHAAMVSLLTARLDG